MKKIIQFLVEWVLLFPFGILFMTEVTIRSAMLVFIYPFTKNDSIMGKSYSIKLYEHLSLKIWK